MLLLLGDHPLPIRLTASFTEGFLCFSTHRNGLLKFTTVLSLRRFIGFYGCNGAVVSRIRVTPLSCFPHRAAFKSLLMGSFKLGFVSLIQLLANIATRKGSCNRSNSRCNDLSTTASNCRSPPKPLKHRPQGYQLLVLGFHILLLTSLSREHSQSILSSYPFPS